MMELRKDYILDRWAIIAAKRGKRPHQFKQEEQDKKVDVCYFCPGNEKTTPPEISRVDDGKGGWKIRVFPNKFAAVEPEGDPAIKTDNKYFTYSSAFGDHEVIVETPDHEKDLHDLDVGHIKQVLEVVRDRIEAMSKREEVRYVCAFKNHGSAAGTSLVHTHIQIISYNKIPTIIEDKIEKNKVECHYCRIPNIEKESFRRCFENEHWISFTPYASRFNFENWIFPKKHAKNLGEFNDEELLALAEVMKKVLVKLSELNAPYNMAFYYSPRGEDMHFHIEIMPRIAKWAGFELLSETTINTVAPEDAAKFYRGEE